MNLTQKLALSKKSHSIYFFREGIFAKVFHVSLYLTVTQLGLGVKICGYRYKSLNNQLILRAGFPTTKLEERFPDLIKHDFGYELKGDWLFDQNDYQQWYQSRLQQQLLLEAQKTNSKTVDNSHQTTKNSEVVAGALWPLGSKSLSLTEQEYQFLKAWQQDKYPTAVESGFIRGLQQKIIGELQ